MIGDNDALEYGAPESERMGGAELQVWLDLLGLTHETAAILLHVRPDTVTKWCKGRALVPFAVADELAKIDADTSAAIGRVVDALRDSRKPGVTIYRGDDEMWQEMPDLAPYGARWWRMVAARASLEVPDVDFRWDTP